MAAIFEALRIKNIPRSKGVLTSISKNQKGQKTKDRGSLRIQMSSSMLKLL